MGEAHAAQRKLDEAQEQNDKLRESKERHLSNANTYLEMVQSVAGALPPADGPREYALLGGEVCELVQQLNAWSSAAAAACQGVVVTPSVSPRPGHVRELGELAAARWAKLEAVAEAIQAEPQQVDGASVQAFLDEAMRQYHAALVSAWMGAQALVVDRPVPPAEDLPLSVVRSGLEQTLAAAAIVAPAERRDALRWARALVTIREAFWSDDETASEQVEDLRQIARVALEPQAQPAEVDAGWSERDAELNAAEGGA